MSPPPPSLWLGVKGERQTGIGGGVTTVKDKEQSLLLEAEGAKGAQGALLNVGLPCFHDSTAETAEHRRPFLRLWSNVLLQ